MMDIPESRGASAQSSIYEIGASVGLTDTPYFCRIFKKKFGMTPTEYRRSVL